MGSEEPKNSNPTSRLRRKPRDGKRYEQWDQTRKQYRKQKDPTPDALRGNLEHYTEDDWAPPSRISIDDLKYLI